MQQLLRTMAVFIEYPWLAALIGAFLLAFGRGRLAAVVAGIAWLLYAVYETGMQQRWLCTGECNIRVDLLLVYPILLVVTAIAVVSLVRSGRGRQSSG